MIDVPENAKYAENHDSQDHVQANPYNIHEVGEIPLKNATHMYTFWVLHICPKKIHWKNNLKFKPV